ncbi:MAG: hypothetical protein KGI29_05710 [Pseudomonadota bacterium]|nr:hypothetical protein [Pseudomonadota bacterium]MDE3038355.1 hypothetical protein [Pseudomonadota bacterium]
MTAKQELMPIVKNLPKPTAEEKEILDRLSADVIDKLYQRLLKLNRDSKKNHEGGRDY